MPESGVEFKGMAEAAADMRRWADQVQPAVMERSRGFGESVASRVRGVVPVLTGTLAASVDVHEDKDAIGVSIGAGVPYAGWIEFGGSRGRPHIPEGRYLYPTALDSEAEFAEMAADAASDSVGRFSWSTPGL